MLTVRELKHLLEEYEDDRVVIIANDGEGNSYSPLDNISWGAYFAETAWSGDFVDADELEEDDDIDLESAEPAIVLWPTN